MSQVEALLSDAGRVPQFSEECLAIARAHGAQAHLSYGTWAASLGAWVRGDLRQAHTLILETLQLKRSYNDLFGTARCFEMLAWANAAEKACERAVRLLGAAAMLWRRNGTSPPKLGISLPDFKHIDDFQQQCEQRLHAALGQMAFKAAFDDGLSFTVEQAFDYALCNKIEPAPAASRTVPALTPRQLEVAKLIADGMSNKDIATRLVISQRTAEAHVEHILTKLGFDRRAHISAWIRSQTETS